MMDHERAKVIRRQSFQTLSEKIQTLSAEFVPSRYRTVLPDEKVLTAEIERTRAIMQEPIKDPARFPWQEVTKVAHYWLEVNAMTRPMMVREDEAEYRTKNHTGEEPEL